MSREKIKYDADVLPNEEKRLREEAHKLRYLSNFEIFEYLVGVSKFSKVAERFGIGKDEFKHLMFLDAKIEHDLGIEERVRRLIEDGKIAEVSSKYKIEEGKIKDEFEKLVKNNRNGRALLDKHIINKIKPNVRYEEWDLFLALEMVLIELGVYD